MVALAGVGPGLYLDLAGLSFHVPAMGSAATSVEASPKRANTSLAYRIEFSLCWGLYRRGGALSCPLPESAAGEQEDIRLFFARVVETLHAKLKRILSSFA